MKISAALMHPSKYRFWPVILTFLSLFSIADLGAQGCVGITFSFDQYEPCKHRAKYFNTSDCFTEIRYTLESGVFADWSVNTADGFTAQQISPSEIWIHHNQGFLPLDEQTPMIFSLQPGLSTNMLIAFQDDCAMLGCELFGGMPIDSCADPRDAKIIGTKYKECSGLPYFNQTPISDWLIQLFDADGNLYEEKLTEADGSYAFTDLPKGNYIIREGQKPGWTSNVPANGQYALSLDFSQQRIANFGNCPPPQPIPCDCPTGLVPGGNAVQNGDFSGSGGFTTSYALNNSPSLQPGQYWIGSNPSQINAGFAACGDHTSGSGNMMVVNGAPNQTTTVWSRTFTLAPNSHYKFEFWVASLAGTSPAHLFVNFQVNNVIWGQDIFAPNATCTWEHFCRTWNNGSANPVTLTVSIVNDNAATTGNDFAIDDISFRRCVVPHGVVTGVVYEECEARDYTSQPALAGVTVQLLDTMGNLIAQQVSDSSGAYAFADLPLGWYYIKIAQGTDGVPNHPESGSALIDLTDGGTAIQHFGICRLPSQPCLCPINFAPGTNLVTNSDFSLTTGFSSGFSPNTTGPPLLLNQYWIGSAPHSIDADFQPCNDHTPGVGNMFIAKGNLGVAFPLYWQQGSISVTKNTEYIFSVWVSTLHGAAPDYIVMEVDNGTGSQVVAVQKITTGPCTWRRICTRWNSGNSTSATLKIRGFGVGSGDAIALDDVGFSPCQSSILTPVFGRLYATCDAQPYTDQPLFPGLTVQMLDTMGVLVDEQVTGADGAYAFYDLPYGQYYVRVLLPSGWTPVIPANGQVAVEITPGGSVEQNFGICFLPPFACNCPIGNSQGTNIVSNPDFSGSGGFGSDFNLDGDGILVTGEYYIQTFGHNTSCSDHTAGPGNALVTQGDPGGLPFPAFWKQTVTVVPNKRYVFTAWVSNLFGNFTGTAHLEVNGVPVGQGVSGPFPVSNICKWYKICGVWDSGNNTSANLSVNGSSLSAADILALDDISFRPCEPFVVGPLTGVVYRTCDAEPFVDQPVLPGWTVQVLDTMGNLIAEQVTDSSGAYAFYDLPLGLYYCRVLVPGGWEANLPASGQTLVDLTMGGAVQENFGLCESECACVGFSELQFTAEISNSGLPPLPVTCDEPTAVTLQCNPLENYFWGFEGKFGCTNACPPSIQFKFLDANNQIKNSGQASYNSALGTFTVPHFQYPPGAYQLILTGYCGPNDSCSCTINFIVPACGCCSNDYEEFSDNVDADIDLIFDPNSCKATLDLSHMAVCNVVFGINWGDQSTDPNTYNPGSMPMHVYTQPGTFTVSFHVQESNPAAGKPCFGKDVTKTITVICPPCNCQESNLDFVQNGVSHPVLCGNSSQTPTFGCPASDVTLTGSFGCVQPTGDHCDPTVISWNLYGPNGFVGKGSFLGPVLNIQFLAADISTPGAYTVSMQMLCPGKIDSCYCRLEWIQGACDPCCQEDYAAFLIKAMGVQTFGTLGNCTLSFQGTGLDDCMQIRYDWGDNSSSGPFGDNTPVTHTYTAPGTYNVCYTIEEINAGGTACHTYISCDQVEVACNNCVCGSFSELVARPTATGISLTCGGTYGFNCPDPGRPIVFTGKFSCQGNICTGGSTTIHWTLTGPGVGNSYSGSVQAGPYFYLPILPYQFSTPGIYTLSLTGSCDGQSCPPCEIRFSVNCPDPCPCNTSQLLTDVSKGFANVLYNNSCKACFSPIGLNACDMVEWSVNGGAPVGTTNANGTFCYTFPGSGAYSVKMTVIRKKSDGSICAQASYTKNVQITCLSLGGCSGEILANPRMVGTAPGGLNSGGICPGWVGLNGNPLVLEGAAGSEDGWTIEIGGKQDSSDVLSQAERICLEKDTGVVTFRIKRPDNATNVSFGCNLSVQLFRGDNFVLEYPTWNPIRCLKLAAIELAPIDVDWVDVEVPYDLSSWAVLDSCGSEPYGVYVRPVIYITNELSSDQGGASTRTSVQIDNFCIDGRLVGASSPTFNARIHIAPNPNPGTFTVTLPEAATPGMQFRVIDLAGRRVHEQEAETGSARQTMRVEQLPNGLYFLQVLQDGRVTAIEKFVKQ